MSDFAMPMAEGGRSGRGLWRKDTLCPPLRRYDSRPLFVAANRAALAHRWAVPVSGRFASANRGPASNPARFFCRWQRFAGFLEIASLYPPLAALRLFPRSPRREMWGRFDSPQHPPTTRPRGPRPPYSPPPKGKGVGRPRVNIRGLDFIPRGNANSALAPLCAGVAAAGREGQTFRQPP